jgi:MFS family permease
MAGRLMHLFRGISPKVVVLGWVSFFTDLASEMLYPVIPLFLTGTLGVPKDLLGLIEGIAEGISTGLRWIGGVLSDYSQKRKPFVFAGYALSAISKPIMGLAALFGGWPVFLAGRSVDRLGKSIRTAARDALIADATTDANRGVSFGLHRAMDTCGAVLGPLSALFILWQWPHTPLYDLFFIALAPGLVSTLLISLFVTDAPHPPDPNAARAKARLWQHYPAGFWQLLAATALFSLGNSSDSLLILRATDLWNGRTGQGTTGSVSIPDVMFATGLFAAFNIVYALLAAPAGKLSDRLPRKTVIAIGWLIYAAVYAGFAAGGPRWLPWLLFAVYGIYQAFTEGVTKACVSDMVPAAQRAGAIGLYYTVAGIGQLLASLAAGWLWQYAGAAWAFGIGSTFALLAIPLVVRIPQRASPRPSR